MTNEAARGRWKPYPAYKPSGVEWLGLIPAHWGVMLLKQAFTVQYSRYEVQLGKMLDSKQITGKHLAPYLRNVDVQWDKVNVIALPEMDFGLEDRARFALRTGDLLVCEGGEVGRTAIWRGEIAECYYQKAIHRLRAGSEADCPRFFLYVMRAAAQRGVFVAAGNPNTIDHLTAVKLRRHRFAFPPQKEQYDIASWLDEQVSKINNLIATVNTAIAKLREYRTALISAAVTGKMDVRGLV